MVKKVTLKVFGMVQGVGYRYMSQNEARRRGFIGYVKNADDGSVELVVEGDEEKLKEFISWCYNGVGPAQVKKIIEHWDKPSGEFDKFDIR